MSASSQSSSVGDEKIVSKVEVTQSHQQLEHQLSTFKSINGHTINVVRSQDRQLALEQLGYKQELDRSYTYYDLFGVAFSIMGLLPSICAIFTQSTSAGASSSWGWLFTSFCGILPVGIALAELGSAFPSASAVYLSAWKFAPEKYKDVCAYSVCVLDSIALSAGACSVFFSCSGQILSCVQVTNTDFEATHARKYGVYAACIILGAFIGSFSGKISVRIQQIAIYFNMFLLVLVFIALPIGTKRNNIPFNDGKFIFGNAENYSNWSTGGNWILNALVPAAWTISAFDSPIHMSEEAVYNPRNMKRHVLLDPKASPAAFGIIMSISACGLLGWLMLICIYACMGPSVDAIMGSSYNNILTQVFMNSLGKKWTLAIMSLMSIGCFLMGVSAIMATSRNFYALCRDRVLPPIPADWLAVVNTKTNTPVRAMYGTCTVSMLLGLLIFQDQGANSLFTIAVAGFYMALAIPMFLKITYARNFFDKGPFFLGNKTSYIINLIAVGYQGFMIVLMMVPSVNHPDKQGMNYTVVFTFGILAMALSGFYLFMHKYFKGPRSNLSDQEYLEAVGEDAGIDAILSSEPKSG